MARKDKLNLSRRDFLRTGAFALAGLALPGRRDILNVTARSFTARNPAVRQILAVPAAAGLSDPALQPKFVNLVPDALAPGFKFTAKNSKFKVAVGPSVQQTGLIDPVTGALLSTPVFGYGLANLGYTWPGRTFEVQSGVPIEVKWENKLLDPVTEAFLPHLLPVDTSLHWAYSLTGYTQYTIANAGVPVVSHLHGGHTDFQFDGNPEFFFSPGWGVRGPQWVEKKYIYQNDQGAGNLWYHDHALGITRLNVYAGLAGFYFVRDGDDTGLPDNPLGLPAWPYEKAYAIQDRMFRSTGELFYPAFPGDPFYDDFITGEGAILPPDIFPGGGPTALAEFFGDHMVVNGMIWPKEDVEPRNYRLHLLNGTDSRFMVIRFRPVPAGETDLSNAGDPIPFWVIGSDQGLASAATQTDILLSEPGSRYDIVFDFKDLQGKRIIMENIGGDAPFGGDYGDDLDPGDLFPDRQTDRIMAFDVADVPNVTDSFNPDNIGSYGGNTASVTRTRKVALFEGTDEYGRLQPLLGTAEPATDYDGNPINWPNTPEYVNAGLVGQMEGSIAWHSPTTENPALGTTEIWEIYNATGDAHPVHLHLVNFEILDRQAFTSDVVYQPVVQHNGTLGNGFRLENIELEDTVPQPPGYVENAPKDMVTALPDQVTRIKATFDKPGRYVWHCHILSHEDHEMMRVLHVGPGA
jgi:FtsP/CotA-like multicopper oxidase with cupredoxin domain